MITKIILPALLITSFTHANVEKNIDNNIQTNVWNPSITNIKTGESCDDGNCLDDIDCFTKDGPMYKTIKSIRKSVKKLCAKL